MPLQATSGAASYDAFGGGVAAVPQYIEDVFSTYLYTGNGTSLTVTNNIDLSTKGGLVWLKSRSTAGTHHTLFDSARGANKFLFTDLTDAQTTDSGQTLNTTGFTIGNNSDINTSAATYASWTFRKQPKFFDVVTWTGTGTVSHNLGSTPGFWVYKNTGSTGNWFALARKSDGTYEALYLNQTSATVYTGANAAAVGLTSTTFDPSLVFGSAAGQSYVGYAFAHDAGGFGLTGTDNVISCGSYTGNGSTTGPEINLGYEPQWILIKNATDAGPNWAMFDNMRGIATGGTEQRLYANTSGAEATTSGNDIDLTATGFDIKTDLGYLNTSGSTYIYIAIRRGPMKVPTSGTSVFSVDYQGQYTPKPPGHTSGFVTDMALVRNKNTTNDMINVSRLTGDNYLITSSTAAAGSLSFIDFDYMNGWGDLSTTDANYYSWMFRRAPSFFDEVCYTGTGVLRTITHNLGAVPELIIIKKRSAVGSWVVYAAPVGNTKALYLNLTSATTTDTSFWNNTSPTASVFTVNVDNDTNDTNKTQVAYLFATCVGVSKVGSYTGTGTTLQIDCGFTGGARFVLIKRTDSTGDWYVWDSARGIVAGNDPYLLLNSTAAEVTSTDYIDTYSAGFEISSTAPAAINASGGTFIFLAIA